MATVSSWNPFGVSLDLTATAGTVTRTSATQYTVVINVSWKTHYSGAQTNYGMSATSGGVTKEISSFGTKRSSGSSSFTGTYSISGNGSATKTVTVTFKNFAENWKGEVTESASKAVSFDVSVPALASYTVSYNVNGGSGKVSTQTKWKDQTLTLSTTKPTRTGYTFKGWATSASGSVAYASGASYTANASVTLYAVWQAITYTVSYNANGGSGAPSSQTKTYGKTLTLSSTKPTRTNYTFKGWSTSKSATTATYSAGGSYTTNAAATLYAVWELAYTKPRVTNFVVARYDEEAGAISDSGTSAKVSFAWETDKAISSITVSYKLATESSYGNSATISASGTSGSVDQIVGSGVISAEYAYDFKLDVADGSGSTYTTTLYGSISGTMVPIDFTPTGDGCGIGMPATESGVLNIAHETFLNGGLGMIKLKSGTDLDTVMTANFYACLAVSEYTNAPPFKSSNTFTLEVLHPGQDQQIIQRAVACNTNGYYVAVRNYYASAGWGAWNTRIRGSAISTYWYKGRDYALLANSNEPDATSNYFPLTSIKTIDGSWENGTYNGNYYIVYVTDADYDAGTNAKVQALMLEPSGDATFPAYVYAKRMSIDNDGDAFYASKAGDYELSFGIGAGKVNRGIYDHTKSYWMLYGDANDVYLQSKRYILLNPQGGTYGKIFVGDASSKPAIYPGANNNGYVGISAYRFTTFYSVNAVNVSSDRRLKEDISYDFTDLENVFDLLKPAIYRLKSDKEGKIHIGFVAQDAEDALEKSNFDPNTFAFLTKDEVEKDEVITDGISYGIGYTELIALNTAKIQKQDETIKAQQETIEKQQNKINELESRLAKLEALLGVE